MSQDWTDFGDGGSPPGPTMSSRLHRARLSPDLWAQHKDVIIDLYKTKEMKLQSVMDIMSVQYGFEASRRNYQTQLKKWHVTKNLNRVQKEAIHRQLSAGNAVFDSDKAPKNLKRKIRRHICEERKRSSYHENVANITATPGTGKDNLVQPNFGSLLDDESSYYNSGLLSSSNHSCFTSTSEGEENASFDALALSHAPPSSRQSSYAESSTRSLAPKSAATFRDAFTPETISSDSSSRRRGDFSLTRPVSLSISPRVTEGSRTLNLATVLRCVQDFSESQFPSGEEGSSVQKMMSTSESAMDMLWLNIQNCVYLYKLNETERAQPLLNQICSAPSRILTELKIDFLRELLSIFSPVNFRRHPHVRVMLLGHVTKMVEEAFGQQYTITVLCRELQKDEDTRHATEMALRCLLSSLFLARSPMTFDTERSIIALLRRDKALSEAERMAMRCSSVSQKLRSDSVRDAAKELAHVYMDMSQLERAKQLCMKRVGKAVAIDGLIGHEYHDRRTIEALEDLARIEEELSVYSNSVTWLQHAAQLAKELNEPPIIRMHIVDKLHRILKKSHRCDEAEAMLRIYTPETTTTWQPPPPQQQQ